MNIAVGGHKLLLRFQAAAFTQVQGKSFR